MTERNDGPQTPMSRMRFSWQRQGEEPQSDDSQEQAAPAWEPTSYTGPRSDDIGPAEVETTPEPFPPEQSGYGGLMRPPQPTPPAPHPPQQAASTPPASEPTTDGSGAPPEPPEPPGPPQPESPPPPQPQPAAPEPSGPPPPGERFTADWTAQPEPEEGPAPPAPQQRLRPGGPRPSSARKERRRGSKHGQGGDFDVPAPGGRFSGGRGRHALVRVTLIVTSCLLALGVVGYVAFSTGVSAVRNTTYQLSDADVKRYGLSQFPLEQAGRFAADYARLCLDHPTNEKEQATRDQQLASYSSNAVTSSCGWDGHGSQSVVDTAWTGDSEPLNMPEFKGKARWMKVRALTDSGSRVVTVPVYVRNLQQGQGFQVVGDVGEMPQPALAKAPVPRPRAEIDRPLSDALIDGRFFAQFFNAWSASDSVRLQRLITTDATSQASSGLDESLTDPEISEATVYLPRGTDATDGYQWSKGDVAEAWVWVDWANPGSGDQESATDSRAYRVQLVKTANSDSPTQEWAIRDIRGGVPAVGNR